VLLEVQITKAKPEEFQNSFKHITETSTGAQMVMNCADFQASLIFSLMALKSCKQYEMNAISQFNNKSICFILLAADY
jgi:autonomous glycyl radical cofactor GrcA